MATTRAKQDRLFVRNPFRHYRRSYCMAEVRWGIVVAAVLAATGSWVYWKGKNPDPSLLAAAPLPSSNRFKVVDRTTGNKPRAPLPRDLAATGWRQGLTSQFTKDNLYVKINGRADYFVQYGFKRLYVLTLARDKTPSTTVDIEAYDLGSAANALGAFSGERKRTDKSRTVTGGLMFRSRNALFVAAGTLYVRAIGSDAGRDVNIQLDRLETLFGGDKKHSLPWAYGLFATLEIHASKVAYLPNEAFSFGFGVDVYVARRADDSQLFVVALKDATAARTLAAKLIGGFVGLGEKAGAGWAKDRYLNTFATAVVSASRFVIGVRGAKTLAEGKARLAELKRALAGLSDALRAAAQPTVAEPAPSKQPIPSDGETEGM